MKGCHYLYWRGEYLVFRRGVPKRVRIAFEKAEVLVSLGTGSTSEARHVLAPELEKFDRLLAEATGTRSPVAVLHPVMREPTAEEADKGVRLWFAGRVGRLVDGGVYDHREWSGGRFDGYAKERKPAAAMMKAWPRQL